MSNRVDVVEYKDPTMKPKLNALPEDAGGSDGASEGKVRWNPVSIPVAYDEKKSAPFVFKTASGTVIKQGNAKQKGTGYPTAKELGVTEEELQDMIKGGEILPR